MASRWRKQLPAVGMAATFALAGAPAANAALVLAGTVNGVNVCAVDNDASACAWGTQIPDSNAAAGFLGLGTVATPITPIAGLDVFGSLQIEETVGGVFTLRSSSLSIINESGGAANISVAVSATDFAGPATHYAAAGAGTWTLAGGSTISMEWYNDPQNSQGAETPFDRPGILLLAAADVAADPVSAFSVDTGLTPLPGVEAGPFSMTLSFDIDLIDGGRLTNRGQNLVKTTIPEPGTLALLAGALAVMGWRLRKTAL